MNSPGAQRCSESRLWPKGLMVVSVGKKYVETQYISLTSGRWGYCWKMLSWTKIPLRLVVRLKYLDSTYFFFSWTRRVPWASGLSVQNKIQGSYSVWNTWKSMKFSFLFFKVMNSMKFRVAVWKSMDFGFVFWLFFQAMLNFGMPDCQYNFHTI